MSKEISFNSVIGEVLDLEDRIRAVFLPGRVLLEHCFADHHLDEFRPVLDLRHGFGLDVLAVAHDRHVVSKSRKSRRAGGRCR